MKNSIIRKVALVLMLALALMPVMAGGSSEKSAAPAQPQPARQPSKTITLAMVSPWDSFIPFETTSSYSDVVLDLMYDKLFYLKADGTYEPRLATSVDVNEDSTVLTFHLREDAKWADGEPVTADDVVFTAHLYTSPSVNALRKNNLEPFEGFGEGDGTLQVEAIDEHTVAFTLREPTNVDYLLFNKFRDFYILPQHLLGDVPLADIRTASYWASPVGSGPCLFQSQISGERIEFVPNPYYYQMNGNWEKFVLRVVPTGNLLAGLMNGEIDALAGNVGSLQLADWDMAQQQAGATTGPCSLAASTIIGQSSPTRSARCPARRSPDAGAENLSAVACQACSRAERS